jgi:hypothetical protein
MKEINEFWSLLFARCHHHIIEVVITYYERYLQYRGLARESITSATLLGSAPTSGQVPKPERRRSKQVRMCVPTQGRSALIC